MIDEKSKSIVDQVLAGKKPEEQVEILKDLLINHAIQHPWVDEEVADSILSNIAREYDVPFESDFE